MNKSRWSLFYSRLGYTSLAVVFCLFWLGALVARAADRYVRPPETCTNTADQTPYTSWDIAATNIQWAVDVATNGDTVWVTNGNYTITNQIVFGASNITFKSVHGRDYTFINGNAWTRGVTNRCILVNSKYITIDGFTISNGYAKGAAESDFAAGGIMAQNGPLYILNCTIRSNFCNNYGGGIYIYSGMVSNCLVEENFSQNHEGGGILCRGTTVVNCRVSRNRGVGISIYAGANTIRNCVVSHNWSFPTAPDFIWSGIGIRCYIGNATVENCTIVSNYYLNQNTNCFGGGFGIRAGQTNVQIRNCIIYSNSAYYDANWSTNNATNINFYNSCTTPTNGLEGSGNITNDPMFIDYNATNYHLAANSPVINTGTNQSWMTNSVDFDGRIRIRYGIVDMGAYERIYEGTVYSAW